LPPSAVSRTVQNHLGNRDVPKFHLMFGSATCDFRPKFGWVLEWCQVTVTDLTGIQQQQSVWFHHPLSTPTHTQPHGLLMVHAMLTMAVWHNPHIIPPPELCCQSYQKIVGLYASIYTVSQKSPPFYFYNNSVKS